MIKKLELIWFAEISSFLELEKTFQKDQWQKKTESVDKECLYEHN